MKRVAAKWVRKAEADFAGARQLASISPPLRDLVCFHCQQSAERYLKALLQNLGRAVPHVHDLEVLLELLLSCDPALEVVRRGTETLSTYAVDYRYPGVTATTRRMRSALRWAERIRQEVRDRLGLSP